MKPFFALMTTAALLLVLVSCGEAPQEAATGADRIVIQGAGATFPEPLYARWIAEYQKTNGDVEIVYEGVGSGEGITRFIAETVDFGASDAVMNDSEIAQVERGVHLVPVTAGMVVLAYNIPGLQGDLKLPRDVYVDIFRGDVWRWDDPRIKAANPELDLPSRLIQVVGRRDSSGTTYAFTNHLAAIDDEWQVSPGVGKLIDWPGGAITGSGNEGVAHKIKISHGSIGYVEYGFAKRLNLPVAILENKAGRYIAPSPQSGQTALTGSSVEHKARIAISDPNVADAYPIVSYSFLLLYDRYDDSQKVSALQDMVTWGLTQGQSIAEEMGYIPLPESVVATATETISRVHY